MKISDNRGFTLIELLLAISLTVIVTGVIFVSYTSIIETVEENRVKSEEYQVVRFVLSRMSDEISGAFTGEKQPEEEDNYTFIGEDNEVNGTPADRLFFTAAIPRMIREDSKENEICELEYSLEINPETLQTMLMRKEDPVVDGTIATDPVEFSDLVTGINFKYYSESGDEFDEWNANDQGEDTKKLPKAVGITLFFGNEKSGKREFSTIVGIAIDR